MTLKKLINTHGIKQADIARAVGYSTTVINQLINHDQWPKRNPEALRERIEAYLTELNITLPHDLFNSDKEHHTMYQKNPLTQVARDLFNIKRNPFSEDIRSKEDIYLTVKQRETHEAMLDAIDNSGIVAILGGVGAGKTTMRDAVTDHIIHNNIKVKFIEPSTINKERINDMSIMESIIKTLNPAASIKRSHEARANQMKTLLTASSEAGYKHVLLIDEAHNLSIPTLKHIKIMWESKHGFTRLLGVVLIGQLEMYSKLSRSTAPEAQEFIDRCVVTELGPLEKNLGEYILHKFNRVGSNGTSFTECAFTAMNDRMKRTTRSKIVSESYPLSVNNYAINLLNHAARIGANLIDADIVNSL